MAEEWLNRMVTIHRKIYNTLKRINNRGSRIHIDNSPQFVPEDMVYINRKNLQIKGNQSLLNKWIGPFCISKVTLRHTYEIELPPKL